MRMSSRYIPRFWLLCWLLTCSPCKSLLSCWSSIPAQWELPTPNAAWEQWHLLPSVYRAPSQRSGEGHRVPIWLMWSFAWAPLCLAISGLNTTSCRIKTSHRVYWTCMLKACFSCPAQLCQLVSPKTGWVHLQEQWWKAVLLVIPGNTPWLSTVRPLGSRARYDQPQAILSIAMLGSITCSELWSCKFCMN